MLLPNQLELQKTFSGFLSEAGLSSVSIKNYLCDLRHFLSFCASVSPHDNPNTVQETFQNQSKYINLYLEDQKKSFTPQNTINRRLASIRRFFTFLSSKFGLSPNNEEQQEVADTSSPTIEKILNQYKHFLDKEKKTHSTVKNYISDLNHFFAWSANSTPFMDQDFENLLSESQLNAYVAYLKLNHTSTSVINRRQSSIKQFAKYCFLQKYIPSNPFEYKREVPRLAPLSWFERFVPKKNKGQKNASKNRLIVLYQKYNSLSFTPYLHLAILVLATSAMVIFGYSQIIKQAAPSSAALPTVPRRQLSFQGRLTDSSGTPIVTAVNVNFKLWDQLSGGTEGTCSSAGGEDCLYKTGTCSITPDPNGIFNTLIGDGVCGSEIASTVFTDNRDVFLAVTVGAETLTPRQQIATVGYALNSETLQGYPPANPATTNTVPIVDGSGDINISAASPSIVSSSGTFTVEGQALSLITSANSGGDIVLQPDAIGEGQIKALGGTTSTDFFRIEDASLTSGNLISGYVGNNTATGRILSLSAGSTETDRFYVAASGQTKVNTAATLANAGLMVVQNGTGDLFTASASSTTKFTIGNTGNITATGTLTGLTGLTVASGTVSLPASEINNTEISELDWTKLQNYPSACPSGEAIQAVGDTLTCVAVSGASLWQRIDGSLAPQYITDSLNLGSAATSSALIHFAGTASENSFINTGNVGIGDTSPLSMFTVGSGDLFQIDSSGRVVAIDNVAHTIDDVGGDLTLTSNSTAVVVADDLKITGDDLFMTTNTSGYILVADGTNYNPVAMSGDITIDGTGATAIGADKVVETDLKAVDTAADEECLTYETTTGDFEWQTCGGSVGADSLDFIDFEDTLDLDANLILNQGAYTWTQNFTGDTTVGLTYNANSLTSGSALALASTGTAVTGDIATITLSGSNAANTGSLLSLTNSGTSNANTSFYIKHYATGTGNLAMRVDDVSGDTSPFVIDGTGNVGIGTTAPAGKLHIVGTADDEQLIVKGYSSQTANLQEWQNSSGTVLSAISGIGNLGIGATPDANIKVNASFTDTNNTASKTVLGGSGTFRQQADSNFNNSGLSFSLQTAADTGITNTWSQIGVGAGVWVGAAHAGTFGTLTGINSWNYLLAGSAGSVTNNNGIWISLNSTGANTTAITTNRGLYIGTPVLNGATLANNYGIYLENQTGGSSLNYAIYTNLGDSSLGDDLLIRNDNDKIQIGAGGDLDLYHDGTNSYITNATGDLYITGTGTDDVLLSTNGGNVGINDTTPDAKLDIDSTSITGGDFLITNTGVATSGTIAGITANSATTASLLTLSGTALTSGTGISVTGGSSMIAGGELIDLNMGAATAGNGINIATTGIYTGTGLLTVTANSATTATSGLVNIAGNGLTSGSALKVTSTGTTTLTGNLVDLSFANTSGTGSILGLTSSGIQTAGSMLSVVGNSATTVTNGLVNIAGNALTTGSALKVTSTGTTTLTGNLVDLSSSFTTGAASVLSLVADGVNGTGNALRIASSTTGALTNGLIDINTTGNYTSGSIMDISSITTAGNMVNLTNTGVATGDLLAISATACSTCSLINLTGPSGGTAGVTDAALKITSDVGNIGTSNGLISSTATFDGSTGTGVNLYLSSADTTTTANVDYGIYNTITNSGAINGALTKNIYGSYTSASGTGATTNAGIATNVYGNYITTTATHATDNGTVNQYGLYIANGTSSTNGTSSKYGLYVVAPTGADTNVAGYFGGTVTIASTANPGLTVGDGTTGYAKIGSATLADAGTAYLAFDTDSNATNDFFINDEGSITLRNNLTSSGLTTEGTIYYDTEIDKLYLRSGISYSKVNYSGADSTLNDLADPPGGTYTNTTTMTYVVQIDGTGSPNTFKWSDNGGANWDASTVSITGSAQTLSYGVTITFGATTGHALGSSWTFSAYPSRWQRLATDMTMTNASASAVANQSYLELNNSDFNTRDISVTGWFYDSVTSLWKKISDWSSTITHNLDNQFNPSFTEKTKTSNIALNSTYIYGTGADGAITVSTAKVINTDTLITGRSASCGDATNFSVTALTSTTATVSTDPTTNSCLVVGDEVLLINLQGTSTAYSNVGNYETLRVSALTSTTVTFTTTKTKYYGDNPGDDTNIGTATTNQRVMLQRVPNYTNVTVNAAFTPTAWNGTKGGVMFFRATGTVSVATGVSINSNNVGYRAGAGGVSNNPSDGGESFCANPGGGGGDDYDNSPTGTAGTCGGGGGGGANASSTYTGDIGSASLGGGGGGGGSAGTATTGYGEGGGGGGGGYGTAGTYGRTGGLYAQDGTSGGTNSSGNGGNGGYLGIPSYDANGGGGGGGGTYGDSSLNKVFMGSGGAGGGAGDSSNTTYTVATGGSGGIGGGITMITAGTITIAGTGTISSNGQNGNDSTNNYGAFGGGGAGGSVKLIGDSLTIGTNLVSATGGTSPGSGWRDGGDGGNGISAISYASSLSGSANSPTPATIHQSGYYGVFVSKEINTPGATSLTAFNYTESLNTYGQVEVQTRTGATADSTDGSWEAWKPAVATTNIKTLNAMDATGDWSVTNLNAAADGLLARNVNYFEDENITNAASKSVKFGSVGSSDGYAEDTITSTDLSDFDLISAWVYATASGEIKLGFGESAATEQEETIKVDSASTWQKVYWDISDIANASKNGVTKLRITLLSPNQTVYMDSFQAEELITASATAPSSTANNYFQYRFILTTTDPQYVPSVSGISLTYSDGTSHTIDASSIRLTSGIANVNYYSSSHLTVTESALDDIKSYRVDKALTSVTATGDYDPGTGADGAGVVTGDTSINASSIVGRACADAINYSVTSLSSTTATLESTPASNCLAVGDEVLLINLRGTYTAFSNVGNYETLRISSIAQNVVTFSTAKSKYYGDNAGDDSNIGLATSNQAVMLQRVPNYTTVTISGAGTDFYPDEWVTPDGSTTSGPGEGGVMFFRATGAVSIGTGSTINANGKGYIGGTAGDVNVSHGGNGGEAFCGLGGEGNATAGSDGAGGGGAGSATSGGVGYCGGGGGAGGTAATGGAGSASQGGAGGGGGRLAGAGGGGYGAGGTGGSPYTGGTAGANGGTNSSGNGGNVYGGGGGGGTYNDTALTKLYFGSAGGGGGSNATSAPGAGGDGGGIIFISANSITVSGGLQNNGNNGGNGGSTNGSGGGGGAGGSIKVVGDTLNLGSTLTTVTAGTGGTGVVSNPGGAGGVGRIATYYATSITNAPAAASTAQVPSYNYSVFVSDEIPTPNATEYPKIKWLADLDTYGMIQLQTRSGKSNNSTDGTWEAWKPVVTGTNTLSIDDANTHSVWTGTDLTVANGDSTPMSRDINYFEDENETNGDNVIKLSSVGSANGYAETATVSANLTNFDYITAWVYATASGNLVKFGFGESAATENEKTFFVQAANTWQKIYWDITDIDTTLRDAVTKLRITIPSTNTTVYVDNITADRYLTNSNGSTITSTPNEYIQYRVILTSTNAGYHPKLYNVQIDWNNGFKIVQTDSNTVRLYNLTGETQQLRLDAIVFGADLAEWYTVDDQSIEPADLVALTGELDEKGVPILRKTNRANDPHIVGAISTKAGQSLGLEAPNRRLLALAGRIPVKIASNSAEIHAGDQLTSSDIPGLAKKAFPGNKTIGKAAENWSPSLGKNQILIIIGNSYHFPSLADLQDVVIAQISNLENIGYQLIGAGGEIIDSVAAFSSAMIANLQVGTAVVTDLLADNLIVKQKLISPYADIDQLKVIDATISGTLYANNIESKTIDSLHSQIDLLNEKYSTASSILANLQAKYSTYNSLLGALAPNEADGRSGDPLTISPSATASAIVPQDLALNSLDVRTLIADDFMANGTIFGNSISAFDTDLYIQPAGDKSVHLLANLMTLYPDGKVLINGDLLITGTIYAEGLDTKTATISGTLAVGSSTIATQSANFAKLTTEGLIIASGNSTATESGNIQTSSNATIGTATIATGSSEISVLNTKVTPTTLIYITPTSDTNGRVLFVKSKTEGIGFTIGITGNIDTVPISFNYWLVETK